MNRFTDNEVYEIIYDNKRFPFLQFIRIDQICDVCYVTLKNMVTGEMFTFEQGDILGVRETNPAGNASAS
ncbi:hypothetical protein [Mesobacillus zeae]|uniref:Uncharacterized protein n=1 Tax=Mesobacillus zeae TaxID=1917180 RepID=A0A398B657_9BACI|nr:hypothetical protein [Mesobacillus zeae]RID85579.1 hypothetical protein D1970_08445 [Mesobacillus zeae]